MIQDIQSYILDREGKDDQKTMKQYIFKFFYFYLLLTSCAFAGNTALTSYYPPPTAAYNKINVATNYTSSLCKNTVNVCCPGGNSGTTYYDTTHQALYICGAVHTSSPANGSIHADSNGTVHVVMGARMLSSLQSVSTNSVRITLLPAIPVTPAAVLI